MVKTSSSSAGGWVAKIPHAPRPKKQNIKQKPYCKKNSVKTLEMVQMKKKNLKKKRSEVVSSPGFTVETGEVMWTRSIS